MKNTDGDIKNKNIAKSKSSSPRRIKGSFENVLEVKDDTKSIASKFRESKNFTEAKLKILASGILKNGKDCVINGKDPIIDVKNLHKNFTVAHGVVKVLKNINITIYPGEFVLILGPSGSGKSTLLNALLGLEYSENGVVQIGGNDLAKSNPDQLARFRVINYGIVFQRPDWIKSLDVLGNVVFPMAMLNIPKRKCEIAATNLLDIVGVKDRSHYKPYELSAGEQEKVEVARALMNNPPIIIADEPTGNLDSDSATKIMDLFKMLNEDLKRTIIMVTHNVGHVKYASKTLYLRDGMLLDGTHHENALKEYESTPVI